MQFQISSRRETGKLIPEVIHTIEDIADLTLPRALLPIHQKSWQPSFWEVMDCILLSCHVRFRVNPHSIICLNVKEILAQSRRHIWSLNESNEIRTHNHLVHKRTLNCLAQLASNDWAVLWVLISTVHLTLCCYHVTYEFLSESTLYSLPECQETPCSISPGTISEV